MAGGSTEADRAAFVQAPAAEQVAGPSPKAGNEGRAGERTIVAASCSDAACRGPLACWSRGCELQIDSPRRLPRNRRSISRDAEARGRARAMEHRIEVTCTEGVASVRLDRAAKRNAIDADMCWALAEVGERLGKDRSVRAVVISGSGKSFCAGLDRAGLEALSSGRSFLPFTDLTKRSHGMANWVQHIVLQWRELPVPVIAAVHGDVFGGGFQLALGADMRFSDADARFAVLEGKWGLVPDMAGTLLMRQLAREDIVRELTFTARVFSAEEAQGYGFVTRIVPDPHAEAMETARTIAGLSPDAVRAAKRLLNGALLGSAAESLEAETREQERLLGSPNQVEALEAMREKRPPRFGGPRL